MLNIDNPTLEESGAAMMLWALMDAMLPSIARTPQAAFTMILMNAKPDIDPAAGVAIVQKACELRDDLERLGRMSDELLAKRTGAK